MEMPNRTYSSASSYRFGFNGKENDNEVKGVANEQDYGERIYDPRIGRFLSVDPLTPDYPNYNPYSFAGNKPIEAKDLDGLEEWMAQQAFGIKARAQLEVRYPHYPGGEIKTYNPSWTERWRNSKGFISKLSYDIINGFYTTGQQLTATPRGKNYVYNLGGGAYDAHGGADEDQRTKHFVDATTMLIPGAEGENAGNRLLTRILESRGAKTIIREVENEVTQQVVTRYTVDVKKFDFFFGKVVMGAEHNVQRSAQNLKDLTALGIKDQNQLIKVFDEAIEKGTLVTTKKSEYGTTIVKRVKIGEKGTIDVGFYYEGVNLSKTPTISTIIPKIHK
jgi:RHS repeat-associated protein